MFKVIWVVLWSWSMIITRRIGVIVISTHLKEIGVIFVKDLRSNDKNDGCILIREGDLSKQNGTVTQKKSGWNNLSSVAEVRVEAVNQYEHRDSLAEQSPAQLLVLSPYQASDTSASVTFVCVHVCVHMCTCVFSSIKLCHLCKFMYPPPNEDTELSCYQDLPYCPFITIPTSPISQSLTPATTNLLDLF